MFPSFETSKPKTMKVAKDTTDNPVTELIYWVKLNLDDSNIKKFTKGRFEKADEFSGQLKLAIQDLGIIDERGKIAKLSFYISGKKKQMVFLAGVMPLSADQQVMIKERFGVDLTDCGENLYRMDWK